MGGCNHWKPKAVTFFLDSDLKKSGFLTLMDEQENKICFDQLNSIFAEN
jgi:hypothetical protein